jgi:DNA-binding transcriptional LysR family regulator
MRLVAALAAGESLSQVARQFGVPKQTVSRRLLALEETLGVRLLERGQRRVHLTDEGESYAAHCTEIVRLADEANREAGRHAAEPSGLLRVSTTALLAETVLAPVLLRYLETYPAVTVDLQVADRMVDLVEEGFDVAVRVGRSEGAHLVARRIAAARIRYCASPRYLERRGRPRTPADLAAHDCIAQPRASGPPEWPFRDAQGGLGMWPVRPRLCANHLAVVHQAALGGLGIALLPEPTCAADLADGRLVAVLGEFEPDIGGIYVVYPGRRLLAARVRAFLTVLEEGMK